MGIHDTIFARYWTNWNNVTWPIKRKRWRRPIRCGEAPSPLYEELRLTRPAKATKDRSKEDRSKNIKRHLIPNERHPTLEERIRARAWPSKRLSPGHPTAAISGEHRKDSTPTSGVNPGFDLLG